MNFKLYKISLTFKLINNIIKQKKKKTLAVKKKFLSNYIYIYVFTLIPMFIYTCIYIY